MRSIYHRMKLVTLYSPHTASSTFGDTSDFCTGSSEQSGPAGTVMNIFNERGISNGDMMFDAFVYFQSVRQKMFVV